MTGYFLSPRAQADIESIWDYSAEHWGEARAEQYIRELRRGIEAVADDPRRGRACDEIRTGYQRYPVGAHVLFYRVTPDGLLVVRILHQRMDFQRHL